MPQSAPAQPQAPTAPTAVTAPAEPGPAQAPAAPAAAQSPATAGAAPGAASSLPTTPISPEEAAFLRARRNTLSNQLESAQDRRDEVAETIQEQGATPALTERLRVLDERLVQLEKDIAENGRQLANAPASASTTAAVAGRTFAERVNPNLITIFGFALLMPFAIRMARRMFGGGGPARHDAAALAEMRARMDRMETAVDAVAVEVERVGESQRFLSQLLADRGGAAPAIGAGAFEGVARQPAGAAVPRDQRTGG